MTPTPLCQSCRILPPYAPKAKFCRGCKAARVKVTAAASRARQREMDREALRIARQG